MSVYTFGDGDFLGQKVRVTTETPRRASVFDVIKSVTESPNPRDVWLELQKKFPDLVGKTDKYQFSGKGQRPTPVCDARGLVKVVSLLSGKGAARFRDAEADLLVRYLGGDEQLVSEIRNNREMQECLPESNGLRIFGEDVEARGVQIGSVTGVQDWVTPQVYIGQPAGTFSNVRAVGNDLPADVNLDEAVIMKTGHQLSEGRIKDHIKTFGGFSLVDTFPTNCGQFAERQWKDKLRNMGRLLRGKHSNKTKEDTELIWVADQDDYATNIAPVITQVIKECAASFAMDQTIALAKEKTRQHEMTEKTRQLELEAETQRLEALEVTKREVERTKQLELQLKLAQLGSGARMEPDKPIVVEEPRKMVIFKIPDPYGQHITQHKLTGEYIRSWESASAAATELGLNYGHIRSCVTGQLNKSGGFVWKAADSHVEREVPFCEDGAYRQSSPDGTFVNSYTSLQVASRLIGTEYYTLRNLVNTGQLCKGFIWTRTKENKRSARLHTA